MNKKIVGVLVGALIASLWVSGNPAAQPKHKTVIANEFVLVNSQGRKRAWLAIGNDGRVSLCLANDRGQALLWLSAGKKKGSDVVYKTDYGQVSQQLAPAINAVERAAMVKKAQLFAKEARKAFEARDWAKSADLAARAAYKYAKAGDAESAQHHYYYAGVASLNGGDRGTCYRFTIRAGTMQGPLMEKARAMADYVRFERITPPDTADFKHHDPKYRDRGRPPWAER